MTDDTADPDLEAHRLHSLPPSIYYIPNFLSPAEESSILHSLPPSRWITLSHRRLQTHPTSLTSNNVLLAAPLPSYLQDPIVSRFQRLGLFDAGAGSAGAGGGAGGEKGTGGPNHVLVNEYMPGQGIMPHEDGGAYRPVVATVSLGASLVLDVYEKRGGEAESKSETDGGRGAPGPRWRILQEPRSLLVTTGEAYTDLLHGIAEVEVDEQLGPETIANWGLLGDAGVFEGAGGRNVRATRTSLTYRSVIKVSKLGTRILGRPRG